MAMAARRAPTGVLTILLLAVFGLAGCVEPAAKALPPTKTTAPTLVENSDGNGAIEGSVVDQEARPVPGAEIQVTSEADRNQAAATLSTDAEGKFVVKGLAPGSYLVYVRKLGFFDHAPKSVAVADSEPAQVKFELKPLPAIVPIHKTEMYSVSFTNVVCIIAAGNQACSVYVYSGPSHVKGLKVDEKETGDLQTIIVEATWPSPTSVCPGFYRTDLFSPDQEIAGRTFPSQSRQFYGNQFHWTNVPDATKSPTRLVVMREGTEDAIHGANRTQRNEGVPLTTSGEWVLATDYYPPGQLNGQAAGVYCVVDQSVKLFVTFAYVDPLAADFSGTAPA